MADKIGAKKMMDEANKKPQPMNFLTGKPGKVLPDDMVGHWLAKNAYVQMNAGYTYGTGGVNHMRMNVATSRKTLDGGAGQYRSGDQEAGLTLVMRRKPARA